MWIKKYCYALDARWCRPRKLKELETLKQSAAVPAGGMSQAWRE